MEPTNKASGIADPQFRSLLRTFAIEVVIYGALATLYYFIFLRLLASPLAILFNQYLPLYAVIALALIVAQGLFLEFITTLLVTKLGFSINE